MIDIPLFSEKQPIQAPIVPQGEIIPPLLTQPILPPVSLPPTIAPMPQPKKQTQKGWTPEQVNKAQALYPQEKLEKAQKAKTASVALGAPSVKGTSGAWGQP